MVNVVYIEPFAQDVFGKTLAIISHEKNVIILIGMSTMALNPNMPNVKVSIAVLKP